MATLKLKTLTCYETDDATGMDEPFIKVNGALVWGPATIVGAGDAEVNTDVEFDGEANIELWEKDSYSADDLLGSATVHAGDGHGELEARFTYDKAHYKLTFDVA
jgi:hypothetical protein